MRQNSHVEGLCKNRCSVHLAELEFQHWVSVYLTGFYSYQSLGYAPNFRRLQKIRMYTDRRGKLPCRHLEK